jgi:CRP-like cAMP-binding protein
LLTGRSRSADVHAGEDGARGLALSASDLMTVLEERPTVAMGMLGTLASRLIEQT